LFTRSESTEMRETRKMQLLSLSEKIIPYNLSHNAEAEACDLAMELESVEMLERFVDEDSHTRVCAYLTSCVPYVPDPENKKLLHSAIRIYEQFQKWPPALRCAMQLNDPTVVETILSKCQDDSVRKQLAFMIGRQQVGIFLFPSGIYTFFSVLGLEVC